jgi:DNA-binding response OmpR family regulator
MNRRILIIEDDKDITEALRYNLEKEKGFSVLAAQTGDEGLHLAFQVKPNLIILDIGLPGLNGYEICRMLRRDPETRDIPILMLTARVSESDKVLGLELGADDYITKPFSPRELVSRVRAVLRRTEAAAPAAHEALQIDDRLKLDFDRREVWVDGELVRLRPTEFKLLYHLVQNAGWVVPHDQLLAKVWGYEYRDETHYLRLYINYLRQKLEKDPSDPQYILTERGVGYRFVDFRRRPVSPAR